MITTTLRKLSEYTARGISPKYVETNGLMVLNQKCIRNQKIDFSPARLTDVNKKFAPSKKIKLHDILINSTGVGTLGRVAQVSKELNATVDSHITIFRSLDYSKELDIKICKKYIGYALREKEKEIEALGKGATGQTELSKDSVLDNIEIRIPKEFEKQNEIASVLAVYDDLMENNEKRIKILEEMAQLIYTEWFVKFKFPGHEKVKMIYNEDGLGLIPAGWKWKKLNQIANIISGFAFKSIDFVNEGVPVIKIKNIKSNNTVDCFNTDFILPELISEKHSKYRLNDGDIVVAMTGATAGKVGRISTDKKMLLNQRVAKIEPKNNVYYSLIWGRIETEGAKNELYRLAGGAAQPNMSAEQIGGIKILVPDEDILEKYNKIILTLLNSNLIAQKRIINLSKIRDLLIPELVTGKRELK